MNWRVIVAVVVALFVGAGAGALAEHQRLKNKSDKKTSTTVKRSTPTTTLPKDLFGANKAAACTTLKQWQAAIGAATFESASGHPWAAKRAVLVQQSVATTNAYTAMLPRATAAGKVELEYLIADAVKLRTALSQAPTAAAYAASNKAITTARAGKDVGVLFKAVNSCPKG